MVQGDFYPRDPTWSRLEIPQDRFPPIPNVSSHHRDHQSIEQALKENLRMPVKYFALAVVLEDGGEERLFSSKSLAPYRERIFNEQFKQNFKRCIRRASNDHSGSHGYSHDGSYNEFDIDSGHETKRSSGSSEVGHRQFSRRQRANDSDDDGSSDTKKKRPRYPGSFRENSDDATNSSSVQKTQQMIIGDEEEVMRFYFCRFKDMQQSACKVMGKAFVKLVEPKKQTHHPYTKGDDKAPPWWPPTTGENHVRHKEPDHLLKPERIRLLVHILKMIIEPREKQCPTVQKLGLNVKKLEEVTMEAMSNWFSDKEHPENASKRPFLKEIFKIARADERYRNGEIDASAVIPVMYGDKAAATDGSEDENEDNFKGEDDELEHETLPASTNSMPTPESLVSPAMGQSHHLQHQADSESNHLKIRHLPVRHNPQAMDDHSYHDQSFSRGMGLYFQPQSPGIQDPARRQFISPNPSFHNPQQSMFWPNNVVSNPTNSGNYYVTSSQQPGPPLNAPFNQLPLPNSQQAVLPPPHHFDGVPPSRTYDTAPALGNQLRTGSLSHPHHLPQHHNFQDFLQDHNSFGQHDTELKDSHHLQSS